MSKEVAPTIDKEQPLLLTKEQEELSLKPINRHQECSTKRVRESSSRATKERRREKERRVATSSLAALCSCCPM